MSRFLGKLAFVHRRLWQRDGWYRAASLFGPPPLIGAALAAAVWFGMTDLRTTTDQPAIWAKQRPVAEWKTTAHDAPALPPAKPLPPMGENGLPVGLESGWEATAHAITVSETMDVDVKRTALVPLRIEGTTVTMADVLAGGPPGTLYVANGFGILVIREAGTYAVSARLTRPAGPAADCLVRVGELGSRRIISELTINMVRDVRKDFQTEYFNLQPGLYPLAWAFGCWHGHEMLGPGQLTILIGRPGSEALEPLRPEEIARPKRAAQ